MAGLLAACALTAITRVDEMQYGVHRKQQQSISAVLCCLFACRV